MVSRWLLTPLVVCGLAGGLAACGSTPSGDRGLATSQPGPASRLYKVGKPYRIKGVWYYPQIDYGYVEEGVASWYGPGFHGQATANGEIYDQNDMTAAHRTLPLPSIVRVTNLENGRSIKLRVNDRGPFAQSRIIDLSRRGAQILGFYNAGTARVRVEIDAEESRQLAIALTGTDYPGQASGAMLASRPPPSPEPAYEAPASQPPASEAPPAEAAPIATPVAIADEPDAADSGSSALAPVPFDVGAVPVGPAEQPTSEPVAPLAFAPAYVPVAPVIVGEVPFSGPSRAYVQAGAFSHPANAERARTQLARLGPVHVTNIGSGGRDLWRVRLGPLGSPDEAERLVAPVLRSGYPGSHVVIE